MKNESSPRLIGFLPGDLAREEWIRTKYGGLFAALAERYPHLAVRSAALSGWARGWNALQTFHPSLRRWRERFYMNAPAFRARSRRIAAGLRTGDPTGDVLFQLGVLFDARWGEPQIPGVIYTDYTAVLAARHPELGRAPWKAGEMEVWLSLERTALRRASLVFTWSEYARQSLLSDYALAPDRVVTVGGGVNFPLPNSAPNAVGRPPTALFIGKDFLRKGGDRLLSAFALVRRRVPDARLVLLTREPIPAELPLAGVEQVAPTRDREAIADLYRRTDLFVLPSRLETWGDVLLEAMAFRLPCIGVVDTPMAEIILPGETGLLVSPDPGDVADLAEAMVRLLADRPLRLSLGRAGRERVEREFTWERVVARMAPGLDAVAAEGRSLRASPN